MRERRAERRRDLEAKGDEAFMARFCAAILEAYPGALPHEAEAIARRTYQRNSGRVGRSAAARELDPQMIRLAVRAHLRHEHTPYDELLMQGMPRQLARREIREGLDAVEGRWAEE